MAPTTKKRLRSDEVIFLVGKCNSEILGAKLPSIKQVFQVLFYKLRVDKMDMKQSLRFTINQVIPFWEKASIPTLVKSSCIRKLQKLYDEWAALQRNASKKIEVFRTRENEFREKIEDFIFDIASPDALLTMKLTEDKEFLIQQRKKGRPGSLMGIDQKAAEKEKNKLERMERANVYKRKHQEETTSGS